MTLLSRPVRPGPATHAIVIGVGHYDCDALETLTSPPISAGAIARWLETEYQNLDAPLATIDLYVSGEARPADVQSFKLTGIDRANRTNVVDGILDWSARLDGSTDDIGLFFFCGHGVSAGIQSGLLLDDFDPDADDALEGSIDINRLHAAMDRKRSRRQVYFIDACRNSPDDIGELDTSSGVGQHVVTGKRRKAQFGGRDAPIFFATQLGARAKGKKNDISLFTAAMLQTLRGGAGVETEDDEWVIKTDRMLSSLNEFLTANSRGKRGPSPAESVFGSGFVLHRLPNAPRVPVSVYCNPETANCVAKLWYVDPDGSRTRRAALSQDRWDLECDVGTHTFHAEFDPGPPYKRGQRKKTVIPPRQNIGIKV